MLPILWVISWLVSYQSGILWQSHDSPSCLLFTGMYHTILGFTDNHVILLLALSSLVSIIQFWDSLTITWFSFLLSLHWYLSYNSGIHWQSHDSPSCFLITGRYHTILGFTDNHMIVLHAFSSLVCIIPL